MELLLDLCDTAIEISTPAVKETSQNPGEFRTQSPQSEGRISQVVQWETPGTNTLEQEQGLALLCADTEKVAKAKVEAVMRHRKIIEYAERIRVEFAILVQECIDEAIRKAAQIAAGRLSDSTEDEEDTEELMEDEDEEEPTPAAEEGIFPGSFDAPSTLALALQNADINDDPDKRRRSMAIGSTRSSSPKECPTPRSNSGALKNSPASETRGESRLSSRATRSIATGACDPHPWRRGSLLAPNHPSRNLVICAGKPAHDSTIGAA